MRCSKVQAKIDTYLTGELSPRLHVAIQDHLRSCEDCRQAMTVAQKLFAWGQAFPVPPVPESFADRVHALALRRVVRPVPVSDPWNLVDWWRLISAPMHAAAVAMLIIGLALGLLMGWDTGRGQAVQSIQVSQADPLVMYDVNYLSDAPDGSLAQSYLALVSGQNLEGN